MPRPRPRPGATLPTLTLIITLALPPALPLTLPRTLPLTRCNLAWAGLSQIEASDWQLRSLELLLRLLPRHIYTMSMYIPCNSMHIPCIYHAHTMRIRASINHTAVLTATPTAMLTALLAIPYHGSTYYGSLGLLLLCICQRQLQRQTASLGDKPLAQLVSEILSPSLGATTTSTSLGGISLARLVTRLGSRRGHAFPAPALAPALAPSGSGTDGTRVEEAEEAGAEAAAVKEAGEKEEEAEEAARAAAAAVAAAAAAAAAMHSTAPVVKDAAAMAAAVAQHRMRLQGEQRADSVRRLQRGGAALLYLLWPSQYYLPTHLPWLHLPWRGSTN